jgi:hypothetical protein
MNKQFGINVPTEQDVVQEEIQTPDDIQRGISQENLEDLRSEFVSTGGIVTTLPDSSEVRDFTQVILNDGTTKTLYMMIDGNWEDIRRITSQDHIVDADGTLADATIKINAILAALETANILKEG